MRTDREAMIRQFYDKSLPGVKQARPARELFPELGEPVPVMDMGDHDAIDVHDHNAIVARVQANSFESGREWGRWEAKRDGLFQGMIAGAVIVAAIWKAVG